MNTPKRKISLKMPPLATEKKETNVISGKQDTTTGLTTFICKVNPL